MSSTSSSPNASSGSPSDDSKSNLFGCLLSAQDQQQGLVDFPIYIAEPSSSIVALNPFPLLAAAHSGPFFPTTTPTFTGRVESGYFREDDSFFELPLLQNVNTTTITTVAATVEGSLNAETIIKETNHNNYLIDNINCLANHNYNNNNNPRIIENINGGIVGANFLHEEFSIGDWDLEDLMKDVSTSFPCLDFQVQ